MEAVQHPQIHLSRTSPLGAQSEGTTAQIGILLTHGGRKIQVQPNNFKIYTNKPSTRAPRQIKRREREKASF